MSRVECPSISHQRTHPTLTWAHTTSNQPTRTSSTMTLLLTAALSRLSLRGPSSLRVSAGAAFSSFAQQAIATSLSGKVFTKRLTLNQIADNPGAKKKVRLNSIRLNLIGFVCDRWRFPAPGVAHPRCFRQPTRNAASDEASDPARARRAAADTRDRSLAVAVASNLALRVVRPPFGRPCPSGA